MLTAVWIIGRIKGIKAHNIHVTLIGEVYFDDVLSHCYTLDSIFSYN